MIYLGLMIAIIVVLFVFFRRPMYETIFVTFIILVAITNSWASVPKILYTTSRNSVMYTLVAFMAFSAIMTSTGVVDDFMEILTALVGRFRNVPGLIGYISILASAFMASLSGSGPANVMVTGVITIPAMKKMGYPAELAATTEMAASSLGPVIPPSATVVAAFACCDRLYPGQHTISQFWLLMWAVGLWLVLQRIVTLFFLCKYYKVEVSSGAIGQVSLRNALHKGWKSLFLPLVVLLPVVLDSFLGGNTVLAQRLGEAGASAFSGALLNMIASVAVVYVLLIAHDRNTITPMALQRGLMRSIKNIAPMCVLVFSGYLISNLFSLIGISDEIAAICSLFHLNFWPVILIMPLIAALLSCFMEGLSTIALLGEVTVSMMAFAGVHPMLAAAMLPVICMAASQMTPPFAISLYAAANIAQSDFKKTVKCTMPWLIGQYLFSILILCGLLPVFVV